MKVYYIPYTDNFIVTKKCNVYKVNDDSSISKLNEKITGIYTLSYNNIKFDITISEIISRCKYGYLPNELFSEYDFSNNDLFNSLTVKINNINKIDDCIWINGMKFIKSIDFPWLYCNIYGVVYSEKTRRFKIQSQDKDGYCRINLNAKNTNYAVHRFVYACWNKISIKELINKVIHHKNSDKRNNFVNNLELVTAKINTRYSILNGERKLNKIYNESDIHKMCAMMACGYTYLEIAKEFGILSRSDPRYHGFRSRLLDLFNKRKIWVDISSQYDFTNYKGNKDPKIKYSDEDVYNIRKMHETGKSLDEILKIYPNSSKKYISEIINNRKRKCME